MCETDIHQAQYSVPQTFPLLDILDAICHKLPSIIIDFCLHCLLDIMVMVMILLILLRLMNTDASESSSDRPFRRNLAETAASRKRGRPAGSHGPGGDSVCLQVSVFKILGYYRGLAYIITYTVLGFHIIVLV